MMQSGSPISEVPSAGEAATSPAALVVIGANVKALYVLARLPTEALEDVMVVDAAGMWLESFCAKHSHLGTQLLRNPINQIPHPKPSLLKDYYSKRNSIAADGQDARQVLPDFLPLPSPSLFSTFCSDEIISRMPQNVRDVVKDTVTSVERLTEEEASHVGLVGSGCRVALASGRTLCARAVLLCSGAQTPVIPDWALTMYNDAPKGQPTSPLVLHTHDLQKGRTPGIRSLFNHKKVVVVGGGTAAAQLALEADRSGATSVALVSRNPLRLSNFDCDPVFAGGLAQTKFAEIQSISERLAFCRRARPFGTVPVYLLQELKALETDSGERVKVLEGKEVISADIAGECLQVTVEDSQTPGSLKRQGSKKSAPSVMEVDVLLLATGTQTNAAADRLLTAVRSGCPAKIAGGYPVLDHSTCSWPGLEMFVVGKLASLSLGPIAGEPLGLRECATRVAKVLTSRPKHSPEPWPVPDSTDDLEEDKDLLLSGETTAPVINKASWLVDTGSLPADLPRKQFPKHMWSEDEFVVSIHLPVPEPVGNDAVHYTLQKRSIDLWVVGSVAAYHFQVPKLYATVITDRCSVRYLPKKQKVLVKLHKFSDEPWRFLKSQV